MMLTPPPAIELAAPAAAAPICAIVERAEGRIHVRLVGTAASALVVGYALESGANGNTAVQRGTARLTPNVPATLLDLTQSDDGSWRGVLDQAIEGGARFRTTLGASQAACGAP